MNPKYSTNSLRLAIQAACKDVEICLLPKQSVNTFVSKGLLTEALESIICQKAQGYLAWFNRTLEPARVAQFRELISLRLKTDTDFLGVIEIEPHH